MDVKLAALGSFTSSGVAGRGGLYLPLIRSGISEEERDLGNKELESNAEGTAKRGPASMTTRANDVKTNGTLLVDPDQTILQAVLVLVPAGRVMEGEASAIEERTRVYQWS